MMKRISALLLAVVMVFAMTACGGKGKINPVWPGGQSSEDTASDGGQQGQGGQNNSGSQQNSENSKSASASYLDYKVATSMSINKFFVFNNSDMMQIQTDLVEMSLCETALMVGQVFGSELEIDPDVIDTEKYAASLLGSMAGLTDVSYNEVGAGKYILKFKDQSGVSFICTGFYDAENDYMRSELISEEETTAFTSEPCKLNVVAEYYKTDYGYVAQYYTLETKTRYLITLSEGDNAMVGKEVDVPLPPMLTGGEAEDVPKSMPVWYAVEGKHITGVNDDGTAIDFERI